MPPGSSDRPEDDARPGDRPGDRPGSAGPHAQSGPVSRAAGWCLVPLRWLRRETPRPHATPFTLGYLVLLLASSGALAALDRRTERSVLAWSSTDAFHLHTAPVRVLVVSALWIPSDRLLYVVLFGVVLSPVERRTGTRWVAAVFASGHVVATLVTELPVAWAVRHGYLPTRAEHRLDVGVSYGLHAALGVLVGLVPGRGRLLALAGVAVLVGVPLVTSEDMLTACGHVVAVAVGVAWWPWLSRRGVAGTLFRPFHRTAAGLGRRAEPT